MVQLEIFDIIRIIFQWFFDKKVRLQLSGYRPEVICLVRENISPKRYLIIQPTANLGVWVPIHEGIMLDESIEQAALRCLNVELGLGDSNVQFRKSKWLGKRILPPERWDERDLQYSLRKIFTRNHMIGKGYFGAFVIVDATASIKPNGAEVSDWRWVMGEEYLKLIQTNPPDKADLLYSLFKEFGQL